jgi:acetyl-CoA C-acetyltransferase
MTVYIVDALRTPFLKARGMPGPFSASDLAVAAGRTLLTRQSFAADAIDEVIVGSVMPSENEANVGRIIGLRLGCGDATPGWTVQRNCASGMQSIDSAIKDIQSGRANLVLAGGAEAMSRAPLLLNQKMLHWLANWRFARGVMQKTAVLGQFRPGFLVPIIALMKGLSDPLYGLSMGQTAEILAGQFSITRDDMDQFALQSHQRVVEAQEKGYFSEVTAINDNSGKFYTKDDGVRANSSLGALAKLKPFFDKPFGLVTAGNSSQVTDGAAMMILASEEAVKKHSLSVLGRIVDVEWAALSPEVMGLGPVMASTPLLQRHQLSLEDIDYWEINEAFSAQVIACLRAWEDKRFCKDQLNLSAPFGRIDPAKLNVDGGAIALGHPVGASGTRIVMHLLEVLKRKKAKRGVASICIGGGQGGSMLIEAE